MGHVCVCVYLLSYIIQGLSYTHMFPVSVSISVRFFLQSMYILCHYHLFLQFIPSTYTLYQSSKFLFAIFSCPLKYLTSPFLLNIRSFLPASSRLFISSYIVTKSPLSFSIVRCISYFSLSGSGSIGVCQDNECVLGGDGTGLAQSPVWCRTPRQPHKPR